MVAYIAAYLLERRHVLVADEGSERDKRAARARLVSFRWAMGAVAAGAFTVLASATGMDPANPLSAVAALVAAVLVWATCHEPWAEISRRRDNQREAARLAALARERAEAEQQAAAARSAEVAMEVAAAPPVDDNDPLVRGERMAQQWKTIAFSEFAQTNFGAMRHTWVIPEETKPVEVPIDGEVTRLGWQYTVASKPGARRPPTAGCCPSRRSWLPAVGSPP